MQPLVVTVRDALESPSKRAAVAPVWDTFLHSFPASLVGYRARWARLLLGARLVWSRLGDASVGEVAGRLHATVVKLAKA